MNLEVINPIYHQQWNEIVLKSPSYSFFHSSNWAQVLSKTYNYKPTYFTVIKEGKIKLLLPVMEIKSCLTGRRGVSLTFSDYCDPIIENHEQFSLLFENIIKHGEKKGWKSIEFRGGEKFLNDKPVSAKYLRHTLTLNEKPEKVYSDFRESTKRSIKKALNEGVKFIMSNSIESVFDFYRLHCLTRKKHCLPPQPLDFFKNIFKYVISSNKGFVVLASYNNTIIAGAIFFHFGSQAMYKFGASDEAYQALRANNLVMWEAIKWYSENGYSSFCFGRSDFNDNGLRQYKNGWGTIEENINYYKYDMIKKKFIENTVVSTTKSKYLGKMPLKVLRMIGHLMYRHVG